jgi:hypothetical protein
MSAGLRDEFVAKKWRAVFLANRTAEISQEKMDLVETVAHCRYAYNDNLSRLGCRLPLSPPPTDVLADPSADLLQD